MTGLQVSDCCEARLRVAGRTTRYYVCCECGKPCDAVRIEIGKAIARSTS